MALTTRQLNNTGSPIVSAAGVPLSGVLIEFTLLDIYGNPTDTFDLTTGEMVYGSTSATTDANGLFTAQLWPNDRGTTSTAYRCIVHSPLIDGFLGTVASGATPLSWYTFRNQAVTYTPAQFTALDAHINNPTGAHAASAISNTPAGNISAVDVQTALNELDTKKGAVAGNLSQFAATTSAQLAGVLTDETGSGLAVFNNGPTLIAPVLGVATGTSFNSITALSSTTPAMDGVAAVGTGTTTARGDHVHPSDTSRALLAGSASQTFSVSPATTGTMAPQASQLLGKNVAVNGGREISQVNGMTLITPLTGTWPIDNVYFQSTQASKLQCQQVTNQLNSLGAPFALAWSVFTSYTPISTDAISESTPIEGFNLARFAWGTANAKPMSVQFKVNVPAGTYSGAIQNYAQTRSYPFSFTVSAADVAAGGKLVTVPNIPGDTAGTWVGATNAGAAYISFDLGSGANFKGAAGAWATADYRGVTGASNLVSQVNGTILAITDVQVEVGSFCTQYERKLVRQVLRECRSYLPCFNSTGSAGYMPVDCFAYDATHIIANFKFTTGTRVPVTGFVLSSDAHLSFGVATWSGISALGMTGQASLSSVSLIVTMIGATALQANSMYWNSLSGQLYFTGAQI